MKRRLSIAAVSLFWLVMMVLLVRRQATVTAEEQFYRDLALSGLTDQTVVMDVYWNGRRVGDTRTARTVYADGMAIRTVAELALDDSPSGKISFSSMARLDETFRIDYLTAKASWGTKKLSALGRAQGDDIQLQVTGLGPAPETITIPNAGGLTLASGLLPTLPARDLRPGSTWQVPTFDIASGRMVSGRAEVIDTQKIMWKGTFHNCYRISFSDSLGRPTLTAWSDCKGTLIKAEVAGVKLVRRPDED